MYNMLKFQIFRSWTFCLAVKCPVFILSVIIYALAEQTRLETAGGTPLHGHPMANHIHVVLYWNGMFSLQFNSKHWLCLKKTKNKHPLTKVTFKDWKPLRVTGDTSMCLVCNQLR